MHKEKELEQDRTKSNLTISSTPYPVFYGFPKNLIYVEKDKKCQLHGHKKQDQ